VNLVITAERCHVHGIGLHALRTLLTLGIAALSFRFVEQPIRRNGLSFGPARVVVPTAFAAAFLAVVLGTLPRPRPDQASIGLHRFVSRALAPPVPVRLRVRVIGDSTAIALGWVLRSVATPDVAVELQGKNGLNLIEDEGRWWPDDGGFDATVVGLGGAFLYGIHVRGRWTLACHPRWNHLFESGLSSRLRELAGSKSQLWIATAPYALGPYDNAPRREQVDCINASIRKIAGRFPEWRVIDLAEMICPKGDCLREVDGQALRPDGVHYNVPAAAEIGKSLLRMIDPPRDPTATGPR
jgi:hypothetical protein